MLVRRVLQAIGVLGIAACGESVLADPSEAVVKISATGCRPTSVVAHGVVVADDLVATVAHAVAGEEEIVVEHGGRSLPGRVVAVDTVLDAAIVRVDDLDTDPLDRREHRDGETVVLLTEDDDGNVVEQPVEVSGRATIRTSDIYREGEHTRPALDIAADVRGGDSGAPLVGDDGKLVALVWATSRRTDDRAWALPIEAIDSLVEQAEATEHGAPPVRCSR